MYLPKDMGGLLIQKIMLYYTIIINLLRFLKENIFYSKNLIKVKRDEKNNKMILLLYNITNIYFVSYFKI